MGIITKLRCCHIPKFPPNIIDDGKLSITYFIQFISR